MIVMYYCFIIMMKAFLVISRIVAHLSAIIFNQQNCEQKNTYILDCM